MKESMRAKSEEGKAVVNRFDEGEVGGKRVEDGDNHSVQEKEIARWKRDEGKRGTKIKDNRVKQTVTVIEI